MAVTGETPAFHWLVVGLSFFSRYLNVHPLLSLISSFHQPACISGPGLYYRDQCPAVVARWCWAMLLVVLVPDLLVTLRCLFYWCTESAIGAVGGVEGRRQAVTAYLVVSGEGVGISTYLFLFFFYFIKSSSGLHKYTYHTVWNIKCGVFLCL